MIQSEDFNLFSNKNFKIVSKQKPTTKQLKDLIFAFNVCRYVKSNAIVLASNETTIGIGSGQPSRLDSCKIAVQKAKQFQSSKIRNSIAASDAFFPCLLYTSPSPRDRQKSRMPSSA